MERPDPLARQVALRAAALRLLSWNLPPRLRRRRRRADAPPQRPGRLLLPQRPRRTVPRALLLPALHPLPRLGVVWQRLHVPHDLPHHRPHHPRRGHPRHGREGHHHHPRHAGAAQRGLHRAAAHPGDQGAGGGVHSNARDPRVLCSVHRRSRRLRWLRIHLGPRLLHVRHCGNGCRVGYRLLLHDAQACVQRRQGDGLPARISPGRF
mmetsp:Transcript_41450/g.114101  ORF Transcript_41450/g.114101 Transcript_41450/m.114101 type:complete len:208 (+) Transcript_41450:628-1251(+)